MAVSRSIRVVMLGTALSFMAPMASAFAQDEAGALSSREAIVLQNQIAALRQQLSQAQNNALAAPSSSSEGSVSKSDGNLVAQLLDRVSALEEQNRQMRGQLDQLSNSFNQAQATLSKKISDMQFAAQNGGGSAASDVDSSQSMDTKATKTLSAPGAAATGGEVAATQPKTALEALKQGNSALRAGRYSEAETDARFAVKTAKTQGGRMDAQFLLGQSLAGQKQYRQSAVAYYDAYGKSPRSPKAQDSLLGVAASLIALGDKSSACQALDKLKSEFPSPTPRVKAASKTFRERAACH
ncbi:tetratricopeptide repeat protein [Swingsia samuiensis]|uniref:Tetratricopeptide repeat protein n=1 Tax=Swingsia samuiensis TaxID=1293412 RepID=A0A4Y6UIE3_9PROT|nr:tetratricopeptide repeat protein [Swingsia samuiensis]QDH17292.1 tetratricopeptide repeat protein [Swingsia samuiensis]